MNEIQLNDSKVSEVNKDIIWVPSEMLRYVLEATIDDPNVLAILPYDYDRKPGAKETLAIILIHVDNTIAGNESETSLVENKVSFCMQALGVDRAHAHALGADGIHNYLSSRGGYNEEYVWPLNNENWKMACRDTHLLESVMSVLETVSDEEEE